MERFFKKISFEQFSKDLVSNNNLEEMYKQLSVPKRGTKKAAGYDFHAPFAFNIKPGEIVKIPTGIKAAMRDDEFLMVVVRSSVGFKYNVRLCNQVGIIDGDYYNNDNNEGHIWIAFQNEGDKVWEVQQNDRIAQGIFVKYGVTDDEEEIKVSRQGGFGSTNKGVL